jgi:hypothetical protein
MLFKYMITVLAQNTFIFIYPVAETVYANSSALLSPTMALSAPPSGL